MALYRTHGVLCTNVSKPIWNDDGDGPSSVGSRLQNANSRRQLSPLVTPQTDIEVDPRQLGPPSSTTGSNTIRRNCSGSNSQNGCCILQSAAGRALLVLGYPPEDITRAGLQIQRRGEGKCRQHPSIARTAFAAVYHTVLNSSVSTAMLAYPHHNIPVYSFR